MIINYDQQVREITVNDNSYRHRAVMGEHNLTLYFSLPEFVEIPIGAWTEFQGERYELMQPGTFKKQGSRNYEYTLVLDSAQGKLTRYKLRNTVDRRLKFNYTARPEDHVRLLVENLNRRDKGWEVGEVLESSEKLVSYNHISCKEALQAMAETFQTEWEVVGKTIHLRKVEYNKDNPLPLSYGRGNGFKPGVGRTNYDSSKAIEILYVQGGERNIDPSKYGTRELLLPKGQTLVYEGRTYVSDAEGVSIRRSEAEKPLRTHEEESLDCSHIYPGRTGEVTRVEMLDAENHFWDFFDTTIPEALDFSRYRIGGEKITIAFQSGMLAGREFEIEQSEADVSGYVHSERRFKLVPAEIDGQIMPDETFCPAVGDKYAVFGIALPEEYVCNNEDRSGASWDMFREAARYFQEHEEPRFSFTGELDGVWAKRDWENIGGRIVPGGYVLFSDSQFQPEGIPIRIVGIKDYIHDPHNPEIELSNVLAGGSITDDLARIEQNEVKTEDLHKEALQFTKRRFRDTRETISMLNDALLNFSGSINPVSVSTMQLLMGDESLQFRFVDDTTNPRPVSHSVAYDVAEKKLRVPAGTIQHMTLGLSTLSVSHAPSEYKFWSLPEFLSPVLDNPQSYYLYAKVSRTGREGVFYLSAEPIAMEQTPDEYHFLVGVLNSEWNGERSFVELYGFSELLPGRLTVPKIVSRDGNTYFDLDRGEIGGRITFKSGSSGLKDLDEWRDAEKTIQEASTAADTANRKVDNLQIGDVNLIDDSKINETSNAYGFAGRYVNLEAGKTYTLQVSGHVDQQTIIDGKFLYVIINPSDWSWAMGIDIHTLENTVAGITFIAPFTKTYFIQSYLHPGDGSRAGTVTVNWYKLVEGNKTSDQWSPSLTDQAVEADRIATEKVDAIQVSSINLANGTRGTTPFGPSGWFVATFLLSVRPKPGEIYTVSWDDMDVPANESGYGVNLYLWNGDWGQAVGIMDHFQGGPGTATFGVSPNVADTDYYLGFYRDNISKGSVTNPRIVRGNKPMLVWGPSLADQQKQAAEEADKVATEKVDAIQTGTRNYLLDSRYDTTALWQGYGGTVTLVDDPYLGKVVEFSRPQGGGDYMTTHQVAERECFANSELVYYVIAKMISSDGIWSFGGWQITSAALISYSANKIDLGNGWYMYWSTFHSSDTIGGTMGIHSAQGTWRFYAAGILRGNKPPIGWTAAPEDVQADIEAVRTTAAALDYLKKSLSDASTEITGGLVMTGAVLTKDQSRITAGLTNGATLPFLFAGCSDFSDVSASSQFLMQRSGEQTIQDTSVDADSRNKLILHSGGLTFYTGAATSFSQTGQKYAETYSGNTLFENLMQSETRTTTSKIYEVEVDAYGYSDVGRIDLAYLIVGDSYTSLGTTADITVHPFRALGTTTLTVTVRLVSPTGALLYSSRTVTHSAENATMGMITIPAFTLNRSSVACPPGGCYLVCDYSFTSTVPADSVICIRSTGSLECVDNVLRSAYGSKIFGNGFFYATSSQKYTGAMPGLLEMRNNRTGLRVDSDGVYKWSRLLSDWIPVDGVVFRGVAGHAGLSSTTPVINTYSPGTRYGAISLSYIDNNRYRLTFPAAFSRAIDTSHRYVRLSGVTHQNWWTVLPTIWAETNTYIEVTLGTNNALTKGKFYFEIVVLDN